MRLSFGLALLTARRHASCRMPRPIWRSLLQLLFVPSLIVLHSVPVPAGAGEDRWWPVQLMPKGVVRTQNKEGSQPRRAAVDMMLQSVAGLAAKAVNEGRADEMVWIDNGNVDMENWYARMFALHPDLEKRIAAAPWDLVDRYVKQSIIKGYILYRSDSSKGETGKLNCSVNVATSVAGLLDGIIVDEQLESEAQAHGLERLLDAREKTQAWCFQTYKDQFNRRILCTQDPRKPNTRDLVIAQKALAIYGNEEPIWDAMAWLEPLSPILGWNGGDEFEATDLSSGFGHIQTATDWCINLPVLMAGTEKIHVSKAKSFDPHSIDWNDSRSAVSFIGTDGDNVQWLQGNFFGSSESRYYWKNPERGKIPYGWSCCFAHLAQLCPEAIEHALATRSANDSFIEWGGGYYYPDRFGLKRDNRWELLAQHARRTWELMKKTNMRMIGFNFSKYDSPDTRKACEVFAGQTDGLLAILAFQYAPYEAGAGKVFWVKDGNGIEVPVITARYSIWEHANNRERAGTPAKVAREIRQTVQKIPANQPPRYDWVITHVWSYFQKAPGTNENAEDMQQEDAPAKGGTRGYLPVTWCAERLPDTIRVVSPEELVWRIRMQHDPSQTKMLMSRIR
jgi:hypothetical protein